MGIHIMPSSVSSLDLRSLSVFRLPLRIIRLHFWRQAAFASALCAVPYLASGASVTINGPALLQTSLIADTTNLYSATITPSSFFPGSYTLNLLSKKPPIAPICPQSEPCDLDKDIALMVTNSTFTYVYGFGAGMDKERHTDLGILSDIIVTCSTDTVCSDTMNKAYSDIYQQNVDTPTVITVP